MNEIVQHIPAFVETGDEPRRRAEFETLAQLLEVPFVASWKKDKGFHRFSMSDGHLMAEFRGGRHWWVIGTFREQIAGLPEWDGGIYEVVLPNGEPLDAPGRDVSFSRGDEVGLKDGRVLKRRKPEA